MKVRLLILVFLCFYAYGSNLYAQCNACAVKPCAGNELISVWDWDVVGLSESNRYDADRIQAIFENSPYIEDQLPISNDVLALTLEYKTLNVERNAIVAASGTVLIPIGYNCSASVPSNNCSLPWALYYKGTNLSNSVPSWAGEKTNGAGGTTMSVSGWDGFNFGFGLALAANGFITVIPDYLGFGRNSLSGYHPYLHGDSEAQAGIDLLYAANELLRKSPSEIYLKPSDPLSTYEICMPTGPSELFVYGHSQGGQSTLAFHEMAAGCNSFPFTVKGSATVSGATDAYFNQGNSSCTLRSDTISPSAPCDQLNFANATDQYEDGVGYCGLVGPKLNSNNLANYFWIFMAYQKVYDDVFDANGDQAGDKLYYCPSCPSAPTQATDVLSDAVRWWITYRLALVNGDPIDYSKSCPDAFPSTTIPSDVKLLDLAIQGGSSMRIELRCWIDRYNADTSASISDLQALPACLDKPVSASLFRSEYLNDVISNANHPFRQALADNDYDDISVPSIPVKHYYCLGDDLSNSHSYNSSLNNPDASCFMLEKPGPGEYGHNDCFVPALREMLDYSFSSDPFFKRQSSFFFDGSQHLQPQNLKTSIVNGKIQVTWDQVGSITEYELSFKWGALISDLHSDDVVLPLTANVPGSTLTCINDTCKYTHPFSPIHSCYRGQVRVKDASKCTPYSAFSTLTLPACNTPTALFPPSGSSLSGSSVTLSWNGNAPSYTLRACVGPGCNPQSPGSLRFIVSGNNNTFTSVPAGYYRWAVQANCGCNASFSNIHDLIVTPGPSEKSIQNEAAIKIYPNPANNKLTIKSYNGEVHADIRIMDLRGKLLIAAKMNSTEREIDVSDLSNGIYLLNLHSGNEVISSHRISIIK